MTGAARTYSERLGAISDAQFQEALDRLDLGVLRAARPVAFGLFGQNVMLETSQGEFVFRGAQHGDWQFAKEVFFARLLAEWTRAPVAWPQWLETSTDLFGWSYIITPRLPGQAMADPAIIAGLSTEDRLAIARQQGETLAALQTLTWEAAGDFDMALQDVAPFAEGHIGHVIVDVNRHAGYAARSGSLSPEDRAWIDGVAERAAAAEAGGAAVYLHNDFSLNNLLAEPRSGGWAITGVVDLMTSSFGAGEADLCRQAANYLGQDPTLAKALIDAYRGAAGGGPRDPARTSLHALYDRLLIWEYFTRPEHRADWTRGRTFSAWARPFVDGLADLF
ncbi:phosphotransferase family protein [Phenylobacterium sp.]|uniref:phosphotransferase family protein n=1 Tax=Phenylobacterium sp. TaxID=1871053 RepID=UPI00273448D4|nr:phosphotransferase [Phenylobacterium sp.]MDP3855801.1 phosphotransferase [Phenylobacterium sp.]